ncbi:hypothetical protein [Streptomyces sp. NRRL B-1140]|nr:hypothetical protein [Streptomyces sp. NRRL B-1140]
MMSPGIVGAAVAAAQRRSADNGMAATPNGRQPDTVVDGLAVRLGGGE